MNDNPKICELFENRILLFIDRDVPEELNNEFSAHVHQCKKCSQLLKDTINILYYKDRNDVDIADDKFDKMIEKAVTSGKVKRILFDWDEGKREKYIFYWKIGFACLLLFASITISLLSTRTNPVKQVSKELLDWEGKEIDSELKTLDYSIDKMNGLEWDTNMMQINQQIKQLEKRSNQFSFN